MSDLSEIFDVDREKRIRDRAYEIWERRGNAAGSDGEDWLTATHEVDAELASEATPEPGDLPEEDDDNPYQESDDALPEDGEERAIFDDFDREGARFDETVERERPQSE